jgi:hypothetical protein
MLNPIMNYLASFKGARGLALGGAAGGYFLGQEFLDYQGGKLQAWHGQQDYDTRYRPGIEAASTALTVGAGYTAASALFGGPIGAELLKGAGRLAATPITGPAKMARGKYREYMAVSRAASEMQKSRQFLHKIRTTPSNQFPIGAQQQLIDRGRARYRQAREAYSKLNTPRTRGTASRNRRKMSLDPAKWNTGTLFRGGLGVLAGGTFAGSAYAQNRKQYPLMEAGTVSMAPSAVQRMNFSTAGLTQALHDRTNRRIM